MSALPSILVVDDSKTTRRMIARALVMGGVDRARIREAGHGLEALAVLDREQICLVICDVNMPEMDGRELLVELGRRGYLSKLPVVMCTSVSSSRQLVELVRIGAQTVIRKPFNPHDLFQQVEPYLPKQSAPPAEGPQSQPAADDEGLSELVTSASDEALAALLATTAFIEAVPVDEPLPLNRVLFLAETTLSGSLVGTIGLASAMDAATELAANLTGEAPGHDDVARLDAVAEVLNIFAGEALEQLGARGVDVAEVLFTPPRVSVQAPGAFVSPCLTYSLDDTEMRLHVWHDIRAAHSPKEQAA